MKDLAYDIPIESLKTILSQISTKLKFLTAPLLGRYFQPVFLKL